MRKASRVLCLIGSCLAFSFSASVLYGALRFYQPPFNSADTANALLGIGICAAVSGALGLFGLVRLSKNGRASGILMLIAAFLSLPVVLPCLLLLTGGILALVRERLPVERQPAPILQPPSSTPPPGYGYPPQGYGYPQYPPYPPQDPAPYGYPPPYGWPYPSAPQDTNKEGQ
jgi:hypothetical protein